MAGFAALRPEIHVETAVWPLRYPAVILLVASFVAEAFNRPPEVPAMACVSITQTAAEKFEIKVPDTFSVLTPIAHDRDILARQTVEPVVALRGSVHVTVPR